MNEAQAAFNFTISEFTVAPQTDPLEGELPYHEWFIEFENPPNDLQLVANALDTSLQEQNSYYKDLIEGKVLQQLKISVLQKNSFQNYMKSKGKLGGQNKIPRLSNDREIANALEQFRV